MSAPSTARSAAGRDPAANPHKRTLRNRVISIATGAAVVLLAVLLRLIDPAVLEQARMVAFDNYQRAAPRAYQETPVQVVDIDNESLRRLGQWPWPRWKVAALIDRLNGLGAAAIALDFVFSEPDRTSPREAVRDLPELRANPAVRDLLASLPDFDATLARAIAAAPVVTGFALVNRANAVEPRRVPGIALVGADPAEHLANFPGAVANLPALENAARGNGAFSITAKQDGELIRRVPLLYALDGEIYPALTLEALRVAQGEPTLAIRGPGPGLSHDDGLTLRIGRIRPTVARDGRVWVHYRNFAADEAIPAWRLIGDPPAALLPDSVAGKIVLIGTSATGLSDLRPTPLNPFEPGVNIHAQVLEQLILGWSLDRPEWAASVEILAALALGLALAGVLSLSGARWGAVFAGTTILAVAAASWFAYAEIRLLLDPVFPALAIFAVYLAVTVVNFVRSERDREQIRGAFGQYLSPALVHQLIEDPGQLRLGGETREVTFLFTDIAGFTAFTETAPPAQLVELLNGYLDGVCSIVMKHGGTIDKIVGDAVHAMFNAPILQSDHAARAVACALDIDSFAQAFAADQAAAGRDFGATRIGVNTGSCIVGNFGGKHRFDYTAHGDSINTAARLEAANKVLGTRICVAETTARQCPDRRFRRIGDLMLKGKAVAVTAFEPIDEDRENTQKKVAYEAALACLDTGDPKARQLFARLAQVWPDDGLIDLHTRRLEQGQNSAVITVG